MADPNRALFESVVRRLTPVLDELVFVGGCTTGLFLTDSAAGGVRPTKDVDAIVDVASYAGYASLAGRLRSLGLVEWRVGCEPSATASDSFSRVVMDDQGPASTHLLFLAQPAPPHSR